MTARKVFFYNSRNRDRLYNADSMTEWLKPFFTTGVFNNCYQVTANDNMTVTISGGPANIGGKLVLYEGSTTLDLEVASGTLNRIDNVVLRRDDTNRDIYLMIQTGGLATNPVAPAIIRDNAIFDLKLAEIHVDKGVMKITQANITDTRMNTEVCGWVMATIKEIDFTQITAQFNAFFAEYKPLIERDYNQYVNNIASFYALYKQYAVNSYDQYTGDINDYYNLYKQNILNQYATYTSYIAGYKDNSAAAYEAFLLLLDEFKAKGADDFQQWFDTVKGVLGQDEAGELFLMVMELQARQPTAIIGEIQHGFDHYPQCTLYRTKNAYGIGGYGLGGYGGGKLITVPAIYELSGTKSIAVKTIPEFAQHTNIHKLSPCKYGFSSTDAGSTDSLLLILS